MRVSELPHMGELPNPHGAWVSGQLPHFLISGPGGPVPGLSIRALGVLVPSGDRSGPTEPAGETLASLVLIERLARVRALGEFLTFANTAPPIGLQIKIN